MPAGSVAGVVRAEKSHSGQSRWPGRWRNSTGGRLAGCRDARLWFAGSRDAVLWSGFHKGGTPLVSGVRGRTALGRTTSGGESRDSKDGFGVL